MRRRRQILPSRRARPGAHDADALRERALEPDRDRDRLRAGRTGRGGGPLRAGRPQPAAQPRHERGAGGPRQLRLRRLAHRPARTRTPACSSSTSTIRPRRRSSTRSARRTRGTRARARASCASCPTRSLLLVLNHGCSELIHRCASVADRRSGAPRRSASTTSPATNAAAARSSSSTYLPSRTRRSSRTSSSSGPTRAPEPRPALPVDAATDGATAPEPGRHRHLAARARASSRRSRNWNAGHRQPGARQPPALADGVDRRPPRVPRLPGRRLPRGRHLRLRRRAAEPAGPARHAGREPRLLDRPRRAQRDQGPRPRPTRWSPTRSTASSAACCPTTAARGAGCG